MATRVDGKSIAQKVIRSLKPAFAALPHALGLSVFVAGDDPASLAFARKKESLAKDLGIMFYVHELVPGDGEQHLEKGILRDVKDKDIHGIVVQLPLPDEWNRDRLLNLIPLEKDVDVLTKAAMASFRDEKLAILPPVVGAVQAILEEHQVEVSGKDVLVIGRGRLVGQPMSLWLRHNDAHVTMVGHDVSDLRGLAREADIIISGAGAPRLVTKEMIKEGAVLVDAGTSEEGGVIVGDIDPRAGEVASLVALTPGGVGPLTVAMLMKNLYVLGKDA